MAKLKTKEIVVRMLLANGIGNWMYGYELQGKSTPWGFSGVDADTRAHELARQGYFDSPTYRYVVGHRRQGKYAQFRIESRGPKTIANPIHEPTNEEAIEWFDSLPETPHTTLVITPERTSVGQSRNRFPKKQ